MYTIEECKQVCKMRSLTDIHMLMVIERYIYEKKKVTVTINRPSNMMDIQLMNIAYDSACNYFLNEI